MFLHSWNMNGKKSPFSRSNVSNERKRKKKMGEKLHLAVLFILNYYFRRGFSYFMGVAACLLKLRHSFMFPRNIFSTTKIPAALGTAWPNCSLFGNRASQLLRGLLLNLHFLLLHFWAITSNGFEVGLYFSFHWDTPSMYEQPPHISILITIWGLGLLLVLQTPHS